MAPWTFGYKRKRPKKRIDMPIGCPFTPTNRSCLTQGCIGPKKTRSKAAGKCLLLNALTDLHQLTCLATK
jgi:hypothetical protein